MPGFALSAEGRDLLALKIREIADACVVVQSLLGQPMSKDALKKELSLLEAETHELSEELASSAMRWKFNAVDKFVHLLGVVYKQKPEEFSKVLQLQGRDRKYFARSREDIESSGTSTQPRQIPGSDYWVMTNSTTRAKRSMTRQVLRLLGYSQKANDAAANLFRAA